ncbi:MAG: DUF2804 domain-containing protein [Sneathiella sp.]
MNNKTLVQQDGTVPFGFLENPVGTVNYLDFPLRSPFRELLPSAQRERQFVHFHFLGFASPTFIAGCSLSRANGATTVFFYLFDRQSKHMIKRGCKSRDGDIATINLNPDDGTSHISGKGMDAQFISIKETQTKRLTVDFDGTNVLTMEFSEASPSFNTLRLCTPTGPNGWTYCQKIAGIPAIGSLTFDGQKYDLEEIGAFAHHDFTAGFLRQDTFWNWACVTGQDTAGRSIGLNLSNGVNETGFSENVIWVDGEREPAGLILFDYDLEDLSRPWAITSDRLGLTFHPEGQYSAFDKASSTPTDFTQLFGYFEGFITLSDGSKIHLEKITGFCERQYSVWW